MNHFEGALVVEKVGKMTWLTIRPFIYFGTHQVTVPELTLTDFASVPKIFWSVIPPDGQYAQACVLHDYLYQTHLLTREETDKLFLEAMETLKVASWKRNVMFWAVRLFGQQAYDNGRKS